MTADSAPSAGASDPGSWNRYAYTRGDPVNRVDPNGMADFSVTVWGNPEVDWSFMQNFSFGDDSSLTPCAANLVAIDPGMLANPIAIAQSCAAQQGGGGGSEQTTTATPARTPDPSKVTAEIPKAVVAALKLLDNPDCAAQFGIGYAQDGSTITPTEVLLDLFMGGTYGSIVPGVPTAHPGQTVGAVTSDIGTVRLSDVYAHGVVQILLNDTGGAFIDGSQKDQTFALLHELGHAMNYIFGSGTNGFDQHDRGNPMLSGRNTDLVKKYCK